MGVDVPVDRQVVSAALSQRSILRSLRPAALVIPIVALSLFVIWAWGFSGLYGQDPYAYFDYGVGPLRQFLLHGTPLTAMFWPLGYPFLISLSSLVLGPGEAAGQIVSVLAGAASVYLTYLLGRDILVRSGADPQLAGRAGALGALLLGVTGRLLESSVLIMADSVALATALLSAWALVRWLDVQPGCPYYAGWWALSTFALAWSIVTRWGQAVLLVPWLAAVLSAGRIPRWRALLIALIPAAIVVGIQAWLVVSVRPDPNLGPYPFAGDLALVNGTSGGGWSLLHMIGSSFETADGALGYPWPNAVFYAAGPFLPQYLTPLFLPAALLGSLVAVRVYRRAGLLLLSWPVLALIFDAGLAEQNPRFILMAMPPIAILSGLGLALAWERLNPWLRPPGIAALAAGLALVGAIGLHEMQALNNARRADLQVTRWAAARVPDHATVLSFGITLTLQHATHLHVLDLSVQSQRHLKRLIANRRPLYVLAQKRIMNGQFAARPPGVTYRFLRGSPGLIQLGTLHGYTLARVGPS